MSDLVGNPEDRFSRVAAHIIHQLSVNTAIRRHCNVALDYLFCYHFLTITSSACGDTTLLHLKQLFIYSIKLLHDSSVRSLSGLLLIMPGILFHGENLFPYTPFLQGMLSITGKKILANNNQEAWNKKKLG